MELILPFSDEIPDRYTQYGLNISPEIRFEDIPEEAETLVVFIDNKDAPDNISVHWVIWNIPADINVLPEGIDRAERPEEVDGAVQGNNDYHILGYQGPKMYPDEEHYIFTVYALDTELNLDPANNKEQVREAMRGHVLDKVQEERGYTS